MVGWEYSFSGCENIFSEYLMTTTLFLIWFRRINHISNASLRFKEVFEDSKDCWRIRVIYAICYECNLYSWQYRFFISKNMKNIYTIIRKKLQYMNRWSRTRSLMRGSHHIKWLHPRSDDDGLCCIWHARVGIINEYHHNCHHRYHRITLFLIPTSILTTG